MAFEGLLGQARVTAQLTAEMAAGKLAHAYLFCGPEGVGRATAALELFLALNCQGAADGGGLFGGAAQEDRPHPCRHCPACQRALAWRHEELLLLQPPGEAASSQIKVEDVREAMAAMRFAPLGGATRMLLIRQAQQMNATAANALLKTLEEPPPRNIIVLTVGDPRELLPTIVSRCRKVNFAPLTEETIRQALLARGLDQAQASLRAAMGGGSLGRALCLDHEEQQRLLGRLRQALARPADALDDWALAEELVGQFRGAERIDRQGLADALDLLALDLRDQAVGALGKPELRLLPGPAAAPAATPPALVAAFGRLRQAQQEILANASPELAVTVMLQEMRALAAGRAFD